MSIARSLAIGLIGFSIVGIGSLSLADSVSAQDIRQRLLDRLEGQNPNNPQQQSTEQIQNPYRQPQSSPQPSVQSSGSPQVSVVTLQTQPGPGGTQMVVTPKGMVVPLPGVGVNAPVVPIYIGANGGYWYVDKNNQQVDLTPAVRAMQANATMTQQAANVPQYAPQPQQITNNYNSSGQQSSGSNAAVTAAAAGLGAMAGAAMTQPYYNNVPYGTPIHYGAAAVPYYNQGGKPVYINNSTNSVNYEQANAYHATAVQQQASWYNQQQAAQTAAAKTWQQETNNPFVRAEYQNPAASQYTAAEGAAAANQYNKNNSSQYTAAEGAAAANQYNKNNSSKYSGAEGAAAANQYNKNNASQYSGAQGAAAAGRYNQNNDAKYSGADGAAAAGRYNQNNDSKYSGADGAAAAGRNAQAGGEGGGRFGGASGGEGGGRFGGASGGEGGGRFGGASGGQGGGRFGGASGGQGGGRFGGASGGQGGRSRGR